MTAAEALQAKLRLFDVAVPYFSHTTITIWIEGNSILLSIADGAVGVAGLARFLVGISCQARRPFLNTEKEILRFAPTKNARVSNILHSKIPNIQ